MNHLIWCPVLLFAATIGCDSKSSSPNVEQDSGKQPLTKVTLQLNWYPEAEHGGYYAALVQGYYRDAGLDVTILSGGPETPVITQVATSKVTFGVVNADGIVFGRAEQAPIVAIMAPLQTSPRCLIVHEASGIRDFSQLKNMTLAMSNTQAFSHYLQHKVPLEGVRIVPYLGNVAPFLSDANYAQQGYVFSEPFVAREQGGDPHVLMLADLGFNPYTSLLSTSESQIAEHPDVVRRMTDASIRGWQRYLQDPGPTNTYIHQQNPEMGLEILAFGAETIRPLTESNATKEHGFGTMTTERWQMLIDQMVECDQIAAGAVEPSAVFTDRFLPTGPKH
jgi:NitT/TauT family transport system substrate-binding protein